MSDCKLQFADFLFQLLTITIRTGTEPQVGVTPGTEIIINWNWTLELDLGLGLWQLYQPCSSWAMNPMMPKITKPANTLVMQLPTATMMASPSFLSSSLISFWPSPTTALTLVTPSLAQFLLIAAIFLKRLFVKNEIDWLREARKNLITTAKNY